MVDEITASPNDNLDIQCPCCSTKLVVDRATGDILHEDRPKKMGATWEQALEAGKNKQAAAEEMFAKGMDRERRADEILDKKFEEALKHADKSDTPPPRIFDLD